jgi:hypothetical protein
MKLRLLSMTELMMTNKCTSVVGHFNGHGGAPGQYRWHHSTRHVRAILEATGPCHWETSCSVLPWRLPGQQTNKQQSTNTPTLLAFLMAMAMHRYVTMCIPQWRRSRASLEATGHCHRASIRSNNIKGSYAVFLCFSSSKP